MRSLLALLALLAPLALGAVTITRTSQPPTGYEVTITYQNASASNVTISSLPHLTDQYSTSVWAWSEFDLNEYKPGDFPSNPQAGTYYSMSQTSPGNFTWTRPFPGGTYQYSFLLNCANASLCNTTTGQEITDPTNPPFEVVSGSELVSTFQVPFDPEFQHYPDLPLNQDYALPYGNAASKGSISIGLYHSPGSISPSPDIHDYVIYLPPGYNTSNITAYPLLYLSHGGNGASADWQNQGYISNLMDRLIGTGALEPTVVVMPTWYGILPNTTNPQALEQRNYPDPQTIASLYSTYLFPHISTHYRVSNSSSRRAFAGLSQGSFVTYTFYTNYTSYFGYFGFLSGGPATNDENEAPPLTGYVNASMLAQNPDLGTRGLFLSYGQYDILFQDAKRFQEALDDLGIRYVSRFVPFGFHFWNTWQDAIWHLGRAALWKPLPFSGATGHGL
ncbi:alpha/beta hydrolase [Aspergillus ibericus CBS 121593]|uniref:Alpha/beta-hydrolase n=1 Tax=Aspergillus ibericus CBS 121593 TaxID=1448316 RepID=A0A395GMX5_9EURO|nr:alpha/beta-hydrolase [Aspergillus ibericus CBS 121593]RAK96187.1 alpha/beta-hydrolase [Aspergillus ibericus CBS 121593]